MKCKTCDRLTSCNGECFDCWSLSSAAWQKKMAIRLDARQFSPQKLVNCLLSQHWMHECRIIPDYMPPLPGKDMRLTCQAHCVFPNGA